MYKKTYLGLRDNYYKVLIVLVIVEKYLNTYTSCDISKKYSSCTVD